MAQRKPKPLGPITNACVAAQHAADTLRQCAATIRGFHSCLYVIENTPRLDGNQIRDALKVLDPSIEAALALIDWSEQAGTD